MRKGTFVVAACMLLAASASCSSVADPSAPLLQTVTNFYGWVVSHRSAAAAAVPKVARRQEVPHFTVAAEDIFKFWDALNSSGYFAPSFRSAVDGYYRRTRESLDKTPPDESGPLLETEDMDAFFCAQEYEYSDRFVKSLKVASYHIDGSHATAEIQSTYGWKTKFAFEKVDGQWLISAYCVFAP